MPTDINKLLEELDKPKATALIQILANKFEIEEGDVCLHGDNWVVDTRKWIDNNYWEKEDENDE